MGGNKEFGDALKYQYIFKFKGENLKQCYSHDVCSTNTVQCTNFIENFY